MGAGAGWRGISAVDEDAVEVAQLLRDELVVVVRTLTLTDFASVTSAAGQVGGHARGGSGSGEGALYVYACDWGSDRSANLFGQREGPELPCLVCLSELWALVFWCTRPGFVRCHMHVDTLTF